MNQITMTQTDKEICQSLDNLMNENQMIFDFWYSELFDDEDNRITQMWTEETLNQIKSDLIPA
jgi:hypothetical protein